jgi:catechol 2,3-dioxygenase-like lactoylglutathione lyase family enzyme
VTLGGADLIGFVGTADVARARTFYEGTLGLSVTEEDPYAVAVVCRCGRRPRRRQHGRNA